MAPQDALPPPAAEPRISVIIPHLNQPDLLAKCLDCLAGQSADPALFEVVVVDNGSRELPRAVTEGRPGVTLVAEAEPGPGPARNRGVAASRAPLLAFTDADCLPDRDWIAVILARLEARPELAILGGDMRVVVENPDAPRMAEAYDQIYGFRQKLNILSHRFSATANMATRRAVFEAVGPFGGIHLSEDLEWGQRAAALGYRTEFIPEVLVRHPARRSMDALYAQWGRHVTHFHRLRAQSTRGRLKWAALIPLMAISPLAEIPRVLTSDRLSGPRTRALAFAGLAQVRLFRAWRMAAVMLAGRKATSANTRWNRQ